MPTPPPLNILIIGAGVCGPTLALMLQRTNPNHTITIIERHPTLRTGGQQIDLKAQGIPIMKKLSLLETIRTYCVEESGMEFVDRNGKSLMQFGVMSAEGRQGAVALTNEFEFMRGDYVKMVYDVSLEERRILDKQGYSGSLTYVFGRTITALTHPGPASSKRATTTVTFSTGETRTFDLVIAADGQWSRTRRLAFGESTSNASFKSLNIHAAYYNIPRLPTENSLARIYFSSGTRMVMTRTGNRPVTQVYLFLLRNDQERARCMAAVHRRPPAEQKAAWTDTYADAGWECPRFLRGLDDVDDFYATEIGQVKMPGQQLYKDRVVLLGDAGYCPSAFTGMGTTLSLIGAYVLAGELAKYGGDVDAALVAYQDKMKQPVEECQKLGGLVEGKGFFPQSQWGIWVVGWVLWTMSSFRIDKVLGWFAGFLPEGKEKRWALPEYAELNLRAPEM
jgi:2-polyprenyl-6-methoxyphenol hydroxylase-like FAD-dependent oxidoreductase